MLATTDGRHYRTVARLPVPVRYPAVAALGHQIWVFGGQTPAGLTSDVQRIALPAPAGPHQAGAPAYRPGPPWPGTCRWPGPAAFASADPVPGQRPRSPGCCWPAGHRPGRRLLHYRPWRCVTVRTSARDRRGHAPGAGVERRPPCCPTPRSWSAGTTGRTQFPPSPGSGCTGGRRGSRPAPVAGAPDAAQQPASRGGHPAARPRRPPHARRPDPPVPASEPWLGPAHGPGQPDPAP